jgi:hypothetical protein
MDQCSMARHPTSRQLLAARRGHDLALRLIGLGHSGAHPPVARREVSLTDPSRPIRPVRPPSEEHWAFMGRCRTAAWSDGDGLQLRRRCGRLRCQQACHLGAVADRANRERMTHGCHVGQVAVTSGSLNYVGENHNWLSLPRRSLTLRGHPTMAVGRARPDRRLPLS